MRNIIHIDNSAFFRKVVRTCLTEQGYLSESYSQADKALKALNGDSALVVTGTTFADMPFEDFIKRIRDFSKVIPIIVLTSEDEPTKIETILALGVQDTLSKSGAWQEGLLALIHKHLG